MAGRRPLGDGSPAPQISIGAVLARLGESAAEVLHRVDHEMYKAKAHTRSTHALAQRF
jgi:GGDEF domain-containing protein